MATELTATHLAAQHRGARVRWAVLVACSGLDISTIHSVPLLVVSCRSVHRGRRVARLREILCAGEGDPERRRFWLGDVAIDGALRNAVKSYCRSTIYDVDKELAA